MADKLKVAVISFQDTSMCICPYLVVAGNAQTIIKNNNFGERIVKLSQVAATSAGNTVVLNQFTDGVSCEVVWNKQLVLDYFDGLSNICALPDTNHNAKNAHY